MEGNLAFIVAKVKGRQLVGSVEIEDGNVQMSDNNSENQVLDQVQELVQDQAIIENNGRQNNNDGANSENESSVDSAAERARGSGMSIDERKSPEE